jgi:inhibitor of cysteine peptidase
MRHALAPILRTVLAVVLILAGAGCMTPKAREVDAAANGAHIIIVRDQELIITLDADAAAGFRWLLQTRDDSVLQATGEPSSAARVGDVRLVGAGVVTTFKFRGVAVGRETLVFTYRRPWETNLPPAKMIRYEVTVEEAKKVPF